MRIGAVMVVCGPGETFGAGWLDHSRWMGVSLAGEEGSGGIWMETAPCSPPPRGVPEGFPFAARRQAHNGEAEPVLVSGSGI